MYTPSAFDVTDLQQIQAFVRQHSFATLITSANSETTVTHLPLLLTDESPEHATDFWLTGHMAKTNSHWQTADGESCLVIFQGPHAYISPTWYASEKVVPTWNYTAVHVTGTFRVESDPHTCRQILNDYVEMYEQNHNPPWQLSSEPDDFVESLAQAVVGFTIKATSIQAKFKLSQNHSEERQRRVVSGLRRRSWSQDGLLADLIEQQWVPEVPR